MYRLMRFFFVKARERGAALLMVISFLAMVTSLVSDFQYQAQVDVQLAYHARDSLQAEYNALSALRMRALMLKQSRKIQQMMTVMMSMLNPSASNNNTPAPTTNNGAAAASAGMQLPPIGAMLEMIPVDCGLLSSIIKKNSSTQRKNGRLQLTITKEEDFFHGDCLASSESEHSKIALSLLRVATNGIATQVQNQLLALLGSSLLQRHFQEDEIMGQHASNPAELVANMRDYVDADHFTGDGTGGDEDRLYRYYQQPYRAKNAPFDSVAEIQLVPGLNDALYEILKGQVTVYNNIPTIELSTAPIDRILFIGLPMAVLPNAPFEQILALYPQLYSDLSTMAALAGTSFAPLNVASLSALLTKYGLNTYLNMKGLNQIFSDSSSTTWYSLLAEGHVGRASYRIRTIFQATEGLFYYVRVE